MKPIKKPKIINHVVDETGESWEYDYGDEEE